MLEELTLYRLKVVVTIVDQQSIVRSAERLHISQPAVSAHLRSLEEKTGCSLIERKRGGRLHLTESGSRMYQFARRMLQESEILEQLFVEIHSGRAGTLNLGSNFTVGNNLLPEPLLHFKESHPDAHISLSIELREAVAQHVLEGKYNLGLIVNDVMLPGLSTEQIFRAEYVLVGPKDHPLAQHREPVDPADLCHEPFIVGLVQSLYHQQLTALLESIGLHIRNIRLEMGDELAQKRAVLAGGGLAILFRHSVQPEIAQGLVAEIPVMGFPLSMPVFLITREGYHSTPLESRFLDFLRGFLSPAHLPAYPSFGQPRQ